MKAQANPISAQKLSLFSSASIFKCLSYIYNVLYRSQYFSQYSFTHTNCMYIHTHSRKLPFFFFFCFLTFSHSRANFFSFSLQASKFWIVFLASYFTSNYGVMCFVSICICVNFKICICTPSKHSEMLAGLLIIYSVDKEFSGISFLLTYTHILYPFHVRSFVHTRFRMDQYAIINCKRDTWNTYAGRKVVCLREQTNAVFISLKK